MTNLAEEGGEAEGDLGRGFPSSGAAEDSGSSAGMVKTTGTG